MCPQEVTHNLNSRAIQTCTQDAQFRHALKTFTKNVLSNVPSRCKLKMHTQDVPSRRALKMYIQGVHIDMHLIRTLKTCSQMCPQNAHSRCDLKMHTQDVHSICAIQTCTQDVHSKSTLKPFPQDVYSNHLPTRAQQAWIFLPEFFHHSFPKDQRLHVTVVCAASTTITL